MTHRFSSRDDGEVTIGKKGPRTHGYERGFEATVVCPAIRGRDRRPVLCKLCLTIPWCTALTGERKAVERGGGLVALQRHAHHSACRKGSFACWSPTLSVALASQMQTNPPPKE